MILAIDTSGNRCGTALWKDELLGFIESEGALRHNEVLIPQIETLLRKFAVESGLIQAIAVSSGPGSFTGLRVGMATAKGLCFSWKIPIIAIPTLDGLVESVRYPTDRVMPLMPARAKEVYWAIYIHANENWVRQGEEEVTPISGLNNLFSGNISLLGEGYTKHRDEIDAILDKRISPRIEMDQIDPLVVSTARLAARRFKKNNFDDMIQIEPRYCYSFPNKQR